MALNPSRVLYDMDSDDEQFLATIHECSDAENSASYDITENMFEKASYVKQLDQFTLIEIQELMAGVRSLEAMETIYELWKTKRQSKVSKVKTCIPRLYIDRYVLGLTIKYSLSQHPERRRAMMMTEMPGNILGPTNVDVGGNVREESPTI
ncbi:unnamed protein product [Brassica rapa subsp. narinosa]